VFIASDVLGKAFEDFKANAVTYVIAFVIFAVCMGVLSVASGFVATVAVKALGSLGTWIVQPPLLVIESVVGAFFGLGQYHMALKTIRGEKAEIADLFSQADKIVPGAIAFLIIEISVGIGCALLLVPGIIIALALFCTMGFVADKGLGPIDALKASVAVTQGNRMNILVFGLASFVLVIVGSIPLGLGLFVVFPVLLLAHARIYTILARNYVPVMATA